MLVNKELREKLNELFYLIKLQNSQFQSSLDKQVKIEQVLAYLEIIHAELRRTSAKRKLVLIDSAAGNCYLSYLIYYFYRELEGRELEIHCVDHNAKLMRQNEKLARRMNFDDLYFHAGDIDTFSLEKEVDAVYSLHACDTATDKTMFMGLRLQARFIFSVACCQNSIQIKSGLLKSVIRHKAFRDKALMMIADSMRALLLEKGGYKVDIFDFVSSRFTDKNTMVRAVRKSFKKVLNLDEEYERIYQEFKMKPHLEFLLKQQEEKEVV
ncbi:methyltransferase [Sunxiuqinia elliptica]|uniref:Methyltransferase domain-containing protein n=1 Tax=Sunxiuqinia elliptica TaxID=655355 RepID=A0A1I2B542_9BACT|nr:methyltransferase [Sunxiuqinia elliptica]SFE51169.1 Methyltransferase domain-containing protein [Sunxiuqinia elliptica]